MNTPQLTSIKVTTQRFTFRRFFPLFMVQFLAGFNDSLLRTVLLILITFSSTRILGIEKGVLINAAIFLFILPFFIFSSYSGKLSDHFNKVKIIRWVKFCEVIIIATAAISLYYQMYALLLFMLLAMGTQLTFLGPVKFSIIPQYYVADDVSIATAYIEFGAFFAILIGQTFGGWAMASQWINWIIIVMVSSSLLGLFYSFCLPQIVTTVAKVKFDPNPLKDAMQMFKKVTRYPVAILVNIHALSWFWALGLINTIEMSLFTMGYLGGDGHLFSVFLGITSVGVALGSVLCAKVSKGRVIHNYVIASSFIISMVMWLILFTHLQPAAHQVTLAVFVQTKLGVMVVLAIFIKSLFAGFYSITCYTELQLLSGSHIRSQVIAANNIMNAAYIVVASLVCSFLQMWLSSWGVLFIASLVNLLFCFFYWLRNRHKPWLNLSSNLN